LKATSAKVFSSWPSRARSRARFTDGAKNGRNT
jgi:hypothetical protein